MQGNVLEKEVNKSRHGKLKQPIDWQKIFDKKIITTKIEVREYNIGIKSLSFCTSVLIFSLKVYEHQGRKILRKILGYA